MDKNETEIAYKNFISDVAVNNLEMLLEQPNIFQALKISHHEIRHSNFLSWLLDPNENHGLGDMVLKRFLRELLISSKTQTSLIEIEEMNLSLATLKREFLNIDILIELEDLVVVIENKIRSKERLNQLDEYFRKAKSHFEKKKEIVFVYLTVEGYNPTNERYINFSYSQIEKIISDILNLFKHRLNPSTLNYLSDYLYILKNEIMENGEVNELLRKIYKNHTILLDRLFEFRQDNLSYLKTFFENQVLKSNWVLGSSGRGFVRFLTPALNEVLPRRKSPWAQNESFLFEIHLSYNSSKKIRLYGTISPGDTETREILKMALEPLKENSKSAIEGGWLIYMDYQKGFNAKDWIIKDPEDILHFIEEFWIKVEEMVSIVEPRILQFKDELITLKNIPI